MKKNYKMYLLVLICVFSVIISGVTVNAAGKYNITYKSNYANTVLKVGKTKKVYVVNNGKIVSSSKIVWKSSNTKVATVKNGLITAKGYGKTYISAKMKNSSSNTVKFLLRVYKSKRTVSFSNIHDPYVLEIGMAKTLKPTKKASYWTFASSNSDVVSVNKNGKMIGKKAGIATITYISVGKYYYKTTIKVIVGKRIQAIDAGVDGSVLKMTVGEKYTFTPTITPSDAALKKITYVTGSKSIASIDDNGVITAKKEGVVYIRIKAADSSGKFTRIRVEILPKGMDLDQGSKKTQFVAHRGLASRAPENSLPAFKLAAQNGFDVLECDVRVTKDGQIVVMHDASLQRMCGVDKNISDLTLEEIKKYPIIAGVNAEGYPNNFIPTLDEFIACCNKYVCTPMVEIKGNFTASQLEKVYAAIKQSVKAPVVISFYRYNLKWLRKKDKDLQLQNVAWEASEYELKFCREIKADMSAQYISLTAEQVKRIQAEGIKVSTWNINDLSTFNYFKNMEVDYISTEVDFL